jgi:D-alanyl-D-alanine carboxypeptidase (penicillin-binding protein 5/6)
MLEIFFSFLLGIQSTDQIEKPSLIGIEAIPTVSNTITKIDSSRPLVSAKASIVVDAESGTILHKDNIHQELPIASLTKVMTALIILQENQLDEIATVPASIYEIGGSSMYLQPKEEISIENLLYGLLVKSGNDAAFTLAVHNAGSVEKFVKKMNKMSQNLGLKSTNFANPMGFDDPENYSTAYDLARLTMFLYQNPTIQKIVSTEKKLVRSNNKKISHNLLSTNALLGSVFNVIGFKTGQTEQSGGCFISYSKTKNPKISIVLGSNERFHDTKILLDWAETTFNYK